MDNKFRKTDDDLLHTPLWYSEPQKSQEYCPTSVFNLGLLTGVVLTLGLLTLLVV